MLILTPTLHLNRPSGKVPIEIRLHQPLPTGASWICNFEIDWPEVRLARHGVGEDALQMIGAQIYTSPYHEDGSLRAYDREDGDGFPVPSNLRDLLIGVDKMSF
ncbi:hypothetical protein LJE71_10930 [Xanthobacter autotrophicus]|uniref:DUF6968 family protein n=1 Tax=Xanthobacter autotrophicus TaxID=280 RepID=UPI001E2AEC1B|nr:hypothetical protein [Xanthobacter autotrophicus]UDQ91470.1 hypothetical protein LJE71_10930 [Xanthobacter autotrophicus]